MCTKKWVQLLKTKSIPNREHLNLIGLAIRLTLEGIYLYPESEEINSRNLDNSLALEIPSSKEYRKRNGRGASFSPVAVSVQAGFAIH